MLRGAYRLSCRVDGVVSWIGRTVSWLALALVLMQFTVVVLRYIFSTGSIFMQESLVYLHSALFMLGAAYTLLNEGHVRVDVFYRTASQRKKDLIDVFGTLVFLVPVCVAILVMSSPYVEQAWAVLEGSKETSGIPLVFVLKSLILVFALLMLVQGVAQGVKALCRLAGLEEARPC